MLRVTNLFSGSMLQLLLQMQREQQLLQMQEAIGLPQSGFVGTAAAVAAAAEGRGICPLPLLQQLQLPMLEAAAVPLLRAAAPQLQVLLLVDTGSYWCSLEP